MIKELQIKLAPDIALDEEKLKTFLGDKYRIPAECLHYKIERKSIDARNRNILVNLDLKISDGDNIDLHLEHGQFYPDVSKAKQALIVGAGPAGMFAALRLIELGIKPILFERGKDVRARRRDLAAINKDHLVDPDSNYCFGEGGAGTYSDGKLYTRSKKRGDVRRILEILVSHGATSEILVDAHPHIGTNKLPQVVIHLREQILKAGGEIHFESRVSDFILKDGEMKGVIINQKQEYTGEGVILATGHSARDIYEILHKRNIFIEAKPFAMGVRIEHQQAFVDSCQYHSPERGLLPAASYSLVAQTQYKGLQRGVFSFCMCPGGFIVPASTAPGELVVNGMSPSRRDSRFANSGIVVAVNEPDWQEYAHFGPLAALEYQKSVEQRAWQMAVDAFQSSVDGFLQFSVRSSQSFANGISAQKTNSKSEIRDPKSQTIHSQWAPAQRIPDFLKGKVSSELNETSYQPGLVSLDLFDILPDKIAYPLKNGIEQFGRKMKGYATYGGQLIGIESRTSSPVRIPRDKENFEHVSTKRLFPCGEGAGYAGGIVSAAMDGERCAEALVKLYADK